MKLREALAHIDITGDILAGFPVFARCSIGKVGLVLYEEDGVFRGISLADGRNWQSRDPDIVPGREVIAERRAWPATSREETP